MKKEKQKCRAQWAVQCLCVCPLAISHPISLSSSLSFSFVSFFCNRGHSSIRLGLSTSRSCSEDLILENPLKLCGFMFIFFFLFHSHSLQSELSISPTCFRFFSLRISNFGDFATCLFQSQFSDSVDKKDKEWQRWRPTQCMRRETTRRSTQSLCSSTSSATRTCSSDSTPSASCPRSRSLSG